MPRDFASTGSERLTGRPWGYLWAGVGAVQILPATDLRITYHANDSDSVNSSYKRIGNLAGTGVEAFRHPKSPHYS